MVGRAVMHVVEYEYSLYVRTHVGVVRLLLLRLVVASLEGGGRREEISVGHPYLDPSRI